MSLAWSSSSSASSDVCKEAVQTHVSNPSEESNNSLDEFNDDSEQKDLDGVWSADIEQSFCVRLNFCLKTMFEINLSI